MLSIPKSTAKKGEPMKAGTWSGGNPSADLCCLKCGGIGSLRSHSIDNIGRVSPSVDCPRADCTFHDYVQLAGWKRKK